jgi:ubiquinone/menaquinone biosynthesis C-methylase UbiE
MKISQLPDKARIENEVFEKILELDNKNILELGCGRADLTRLIADGGPGRTITATEVDETQHQKNLLIKDLPNVSFILAGAQSLPVEDSSVDFVFMFKSLHHVPIELMDAALAEISRVLKPGGRAYISEPVYDGPLNEVLRLFHDEGKVRAAAYAAIKRSPDNSPLLLSEEILFNNLANFANFEDFEAKVINVTHTDHNITVDMLKKVKAQFNLSLKEDGAKFLAPNRVNILHKK